MTTNTDQIAFLLGLAQDAIKEVDSLERRLKYEREETEKYRKWWTEECTVSSGLRSRVEELEAQLIIKIEANA